jgi:DNA-binding MarR family transcriptional regulator
MFPTRTVLHLLRRASQVAEGRLERELRQLDVTARQLTILAVIAATPGINQTAVLKATGIDRSTVTNMVRRLASRGLVWRERSVTDPRSYALRLTRSGCNVLKAAEPALARAETATLEQLSTTDRDEAVRLLATLAGGPASPPSRALPGRRKARPRNGAAAPENRRAN